MNSTFVLLVLLLFCFLVWNADIAMAADIQTTSIAQFPPTSARNDQKSSNVGPHDPDRQKSHGVGVNVFLNKKMAVTGSVSVLGSEQSVLTGQSDQTGMGGGLGLRASQVGGAIGFKLFF